MQAPAENSIQKILDERKNIENRLHSSFVLDEVSIKRLQKSIKNHLLLPSLSLIARAVLHHEMAYLFGLQRNVKEANSHLDDALSFGIDNLAVSISRGHIMLMSGRLLDARNFLENLEIDQENYQAIDVILPQYMECGMFRKASDAAAALNRNANSDLHVHRILDGLGINDLEVTLRLDVAAEVICKAVSHPLLAYDIFAHDDEGILIQIVANADIETLALLNEEIADALTDRFNAPIDSVLSIMVKPFSSMENNVEGAVYRVGV